MPGPPPLFELPALPEFPTWDRERAAWSAGWESVAGVDEAGRGPLAGPVVAAAVILPRERAIPGLHDSKRLGAPQRERLYEEILDCALCWAVAALEPEEIDRINILRATHRAMARALSALAPAPAGALVDGLPVLGLPCPHRAIVSGDGLSVSIAAASILAKVTRDSRMRELNDLYPGYGFARNKGYGTPEHLEALRRLGPCGCHRRSFRPVGR